MAHRKTFMHCRLMWNHSHISPLLWKLTLWQTTRGMLCLLMIVLKVALPALDHTQSYPEDHAEMLQVFGCYMAPRWHGGGEPQDGCTKCHISTTPGEGLQQWPISLLCSSLYFSSSSDWTLLHPQKNIHRFVDHTIHPHKNRSSFCNRQTHAVPKGLMMVATENLSMNNNTV